MADFVAKHPAPPGTSSARSSDGCRASRQPGDQATGDSLHVTPEAIRRRSGGGTSIHRGYGGKSIHRFIIYIYKNIQYFLYNELEYINVDIT